jgi:hypothetical protein
MNRTRVIAGVCGVAISAMLAGCGGNSSGNATISGKVTNLAAGTSVSIANNGGPSMVISSNSNFTFSGTVPSNGGYKVVVTAQPTGQTCVVNNGSGLVDFAGNDVNNVVVDCYANNPIAVNVTGLDSGNSMTFALTLQNNTISVPASTSLSVNTSATTNFPVLLPLGTLYNVSISQQPTGSSAQVCTASPTTPFSGAVVAVSATPIVVDFICH